MFLTTKQNSLVISADKLKHRLKYGKITNLQSEMICQSSQMFGNTRKEMTTKSAMSKQTTIKKILN